MRKMIKDSAKMLIVVCIICIVYRLNVIGIALCMATAIGINAAFLKEEKVREKYKNQFRDIVGYMEQMIYSFKKQPKIIVALRDVQKICSKDLKEIIEEVLINVDRGEGNNIYRDSLKIIEKEYKCRRVSSLHNFLVKIEDYGGDYEEYIDILLEDIKQWNDRTLMFIKQVERVRRNVVISIFSTLITCGFMSFLIPGEYGFNKHIIYQISSALMITLLQVAFIISNKKLNVNWIKEEPGLPDNIVLKYYVIVEKGKEHYKELRFMDKLSYKKAKKRLEREISKVFPDWLREVAMNLQNETVQSAVESSYNEAPLILKRPIMKLLVDFEQYPVGIEPYDNFLKEFDLPELASSMKMFYSLNESGKDEAKSQINSILSRNSKLLAQAEEMKNSDKIGAANMLSTIPMAIGVLKIMTDMVLMILVFTTSISKAVGGV